MLMIVSKLNKSVLFIVTIIILFTLHNFLYLHTNEQDKQDLIKLLKKAHKELSELKNRHILLQKSIVTNVDKLVRNVTNCKIPTFEYESLRRRVMQDVKEFWFFINSKIIELKRQPNIDVSIVSTVKEILLMGFEYKRALVNNIEKLTVADGFNDWRNKEIADLSNLVQTRLHYLQNPLNCKNAKKLVCTISYPCGFGCQMHHLVSCMIMAYGLQRTLILKSSGWQYSRKGWDKIFMPLSNHCKTVDNGPIDAWPGKNNSKTIEVPATTYILPRSQYLPLAVPEDLIVRLRTVHSNPIGWWIGQILKYIWKPQNSTTAYIKKNMEDFKIKAPFVGVHIRRTDKIQWEAKYHAIEEYMSKVDEYYNSFELKTNITKRRIYIATDDFKVITEAKTKYSHYEILYNRNIPKIPKTNVIHSNDNILDVILDIHILFHSNFLVCTFSSNICRLAYALMEMDYVDSSAKIVSLDSIYKYTQQKHNKRKVILDHKAQTTNEIDLVPGDIINISEYLFNGSSFGTNLRTKKKGWYPSFKVEMEPEIVKFPTYSEIDNK